MLSKLEATCPNCGRKLACVPGGCAVFQTYRPCKGCGTLWRVVVRPLPSKDPSVRIHTLNMSEA